MGSFIVARPRSTNDAARPRPHQDMTDHAADPIMNVGAGPEGPSR
jgi:hypothetical protein